MSTFSKDLVQKYGLLTGILTLHLILQIPHLKLDFWNDELYSLEHFIIPPVLKAITDYHSTNNHLLFSLLAHIWTYTGSVIDVKGAISHLAWVRTFPFLCSCATVVGVFHIGYRLGGKQAAIISALILITSIPFYNYAAQMRGYSLSMCVFAWLAYVILNAWRKPNVLSLVSIATLSLATLYTLPSNLYYVAAMMSAIAFLPRFHGSENSGYKPTLAIMAAIATGVIAALLLYYPLRHQLRQLPIFDAGSASIPLEALRTRMPVVAYHFLSARYLLLIPVVWFIAANGLRFTWLWSMGVIFVLPFLFADMRGNSTPYRVFLTGLPVLCAGLGFTITSVASRLQQKNWRNAIIVLAGLYCLVSFPFQVAKTRDAALRDIEIGTRSVDLYVQYNLHYFQPHADAVAYMRNYCRNTIPLVEACRMDEEVLKYLSLEGWDRKAAKATSLEAAVRGHDTIDVLTETRFRLVDSLHNLNIDRYPLQLLPGDRSVQIFRLVRPIL